MWELYDVTLCDSHFQIYVMNNVEILVDYYLHITLYVSHALTSCTHITSNSLLSFVHEIVCKLVWPSKIILFVMFDAKFGYGLVHFVSWELWKLCFENLSWRQWVFENIWNHSHAFHFLKSCFEKCFSKKKKKFKFSKFSSLDRLNHIFDRLKMFRFYSKTLCLIRLILNWYSTNRNWEIFSFSHASFVFRIHMHCIVFYIHPAFLQSYLSSFSHIICIHFAKLGT